MLLCCARGYLFWVLAHGTVCLVQNKGKITVSFVFEPVTVALQCLYFYHAVTILSLFVLKLSFW